MIDVVVMYCDDNEKLWKERFKHYKELEITTKQADIENRQAFGEERYRDWGAFKYWFRGVEQNCNWLNKVFLVVSDENQVPDWLDINNPRLRIVYHDEFIPKELLPTFNASTIELYLSNIKDLTDNYVFCNDDFYFLNKVPLSYFLKDGKLVYGTDERPFRYFSEELQNGTDGTFYKSLNNCLKLQYKHIANKKMYNFSHLPTVHNKHFEQTILHKFKKLFLEAQGKSKFRADTNYSIYVFDCLYRASHDYIKYDIYRNSKYVTLKSTVDFDSYANCEMVCFNDTEQLDNFDITKYNLLRFLDNKFPNKSSFEKDMSNDLIKVSVIIPVYNQAELLKRCINSIPKINGVEIIIIDDGSTDTTKEVIGGYVIEYPKHIGGIICKTNHGVSHARNLGLDAARGSYVIFIDSDDYIESYMFEYIINLYVVQNKYDMIFYNMIANNEDVFKATKELLYNRCGCFKFIKREFIGAIRFPVGIQYAEDRKFHNELLTKNPKCKFTNLNMYHYNYPRENSLCDLHENESKNG